MLTSHLAAQADPLGGALDTILGLPVHPLAVHIPVVFLPVAALGLIALVLVRPLRRRFALLTLAGLVVGTAGAFAAAESGEKLAARVGEPEVHAQWGGVLPFVAAGLLVLGGIWLLWARQAAGPRVPRAERKARATAGGPDTYVSGDTIPMTVGDPGDYGATATGGPAARRGDSPLLTALGIVAALAALAVIGLTVVVGHLGSEAAWADRIAGTSAQGADPEQTPSASATATATASATASASDDASATATPTPTATASRTASATPSPTGSAGASAGETYTMADVGRHDSAASCWTVVEGGVYDVTDWISRHPGGRERIVNLCGIDGTSFFENQHGTAERPNDQLAEFRIGDLGRAG